MARRAVICEMFHSRAQVLSDVGQRVAHSLCLTRNGQRPSLTGDERFHGTWFRTSAKSAPNHSRSGNGDQQQYQTDRNENESALPLTAPFLRQLDSAD